MRGQPHKRFLIVFDLDDTLYPERQFIEGGLAAAADRLPLARRGPFMQQATALFESGVRGVRRIIEMALSRSGLGDADIDALEAAYRGHAPRLSPRDGVLELLEELQEAAELAVLSDGRQDEQRRKWAALELEAFFATVLFTDAMGRAAWKPAPAGFQILQGDYSAQRCVYVGDNLSKDFISPAALGWRTVLLRLPDQIHLREIGPAAEFAVESVAGLRQALLGIVRGEG